MKKFSSVWLIVSLIILPCVLNMENDKLKRELMESYKSLNIGQVLMIIVWGIFAPRKTEKYVERIKQGMNGKFAYREAKNAR